ncbi:hypothetical protein O1L60_00255 [Streptomyces diastatochromogenes]|nr:hypothetical protein [Streptomyces diastatochromogenes]
MYRLALAGRRLLLTLDDAVDDAQVLPLLPDSAEVAVLVTSRGGSVRRWAPGSCTCRTCRTVTACGCWRGCWGRSGWSGSRRGGGDRPVLRGLPLALRAAAARLNTRPHWSLSRYAERLSDEGGGWTSWRTVR